MDALETTLRNTEHKRLKTISRLGFGDTEEGLKLTEVFYDEYLGIFSSMLELNKRKNAHKKTTKLMLDLPLRTLVCVGLNAANTCLFNENSTLGNTLRTIGAAIYMECYGRALALWNEEEAKRLEALVKYKHGSLKHRRIALRGYAKKLQSFSFEPWTDQERICAGKLVLEAILEGRAFCLTKEQHLDLTPEAMAHLEDISSDLVLRRLVGVPMTGEPLVWDEGTLHIPTPEGVPLPYPLVRSFQKPVRAHVDRAIRNGQASKVLEALNAIQGVKWTINRPILDLVKHCYAHNIPVPGLPQQRDLPVPEKPLAWEEMTDDQRYAWRRKANEVATVNRGFIGERIILARDVATAEHLADAGDFWIPHNIDYRGRVYGVPHFQFQRQPHIRAMFQFAEGQLVDAEGLYWLKVHLANVGDFNKISKQPFDERVWWVDDNCERLLATAADPLADLWWLEADKTFMFVAACMALRDALEGKTVHLPVSFDGSCSGLQHLAAMSRCEDTGALVNLKNSKQPADIYQTVADLVKTKVTADLLSERVLEFRNKDGEVINTARVADLARKLLDYGVNRSLVKRNVMTYSYSSKRAGMQDQILEDTMRPLQLQVLSGEIEKHPFGDDGGFAAARYLSEVTYQSIVETVKRPAVVMRYLQDIARVMSHEERPVTWTTPIGLPVMLRCPVMETDQVNLFLHDKGAKIRIKPRTASEAGGMDKHRATLAVAPSFVHAYDAAHLMMVVLEAKKQGIHQVALVHDSFGCLPNDAARFRQLIKETFVQLYAENDPLEQIKQENCAYLVTHGYKLPDVPTKGSLQIEEVNHAEYAFA
jgi:DNA-directed RNA polymerase